MIASSININWSIFHNAMCHYKRVGYEYIEVPWRVRKEAITATIPFWVDLEILNDGNLVGSAEQSFIQMMLDGDLPDGKYMAITPCFRNEAKFDDLHQNHFMKLELIHVGDFSENALDEVIAHAGNFFRSQIGQFPDVVKIDDHFDLEYNGIELGSYGSRIYNELSWTYGTGVAEPRLSYAKSL